MNPDPQPAIPTHLGLILDGNRRWAKETGLTKLEGHKKGYENLIKIGQAALDRGVKYLTAFVWSTENWQRDMEEVTYLMDLFLWVAEKDWKRLHDKNVRLRFLGSEERLSPKLIKAIRRVEDLTKDNTAGTLALCLNYGGHTEIADAVKKIVSAGVAPNDINPELIAKNLYAPDIPPIDLIIRTSGEQRLSNFMLWRAEYAELMFVEKHWPAFTEADLDACLAEFASRQRRFGH